MRFCQAAYESLSLTLTNAAVLANSPTVKVLANAHRALSPTKLDKDGVSSFYDTDSADALEISWIIFEQNIASTGMAAMDLIKMDIEGAELEIPG